MCNNSVILVIFLILKVLILVIIPIILFILYKRKSKIFNIVGLANIFFLVMFILLRLFNNNCVVNSTFEMIRINSLKDTTNVEMEQSNESQDTNIQSDTNYRTYKNKNLYYFNKNMESIKNSYYDCNGKKVYMNTFGNGITTFSTIISTLYSTNINPITLLNNYKDTNDMCNNQMTTYSLFNNFKKTYSGLEMIEIDSTKIENNIKNGNLVLVELLANETSNFTCDSGYLIIYNIDLNGNFIVADTSLSSNDLVCPYSSKAYGRVIKSDNMNKSWALYQIQNEGIHYYSLFLGGQN